MLYTLLSVLVALWLIGLIANVGGPFIHTLLVIAGVLYVIQMVSGKRPV